MSRILGWREWVELPGLELPAIKAKVDTGARTSCLHAYEVEQFQRDGQPWVRFSIHPEQKNQGVSATCEAPLLDVRSVTDSGGHTEQRFVIQTPVQIGDWQDEIEITLTNRDNMLFRMLLGRTALEKGGFIVNPSESYLAGKGSTGEVK